LLLLDLPVLRYIRHHSSKDHGQLTAQGHQLKSQRRVLLIQSGQVKGQLNINTRNWGKQTKARKIASAGIHQTCTKRLVQYSIPMSSLGMLAGAPVDMIIPSSMFLYSTTSATSLSTSAMSPMSTG
jgi:hypothetical protein